MKTFLLIFIFALSLKAEPLYGIYGGVCFKSFKTYNANYIYITTHNDGMLALPYDPNTIKILTDTIGKFINVKVGSNDFCTSYNPTITKNNTFGMTNEQYSFMMAFLSSLTGILIGFTILFFAIFLTIKVGSRK